MKKYIICSLLTLYLLVTVVTIKALNADVAEVDAEVASVQVVEIPIEPVKAVKQIEEPVQVVEEPTCEEIIIQVAEEYKIAPALMLALAEVESGYDPNAVSSTGDHGLMQINERNHEWLSEELGITDWYDVRQSTEAACFMINWLRDNYDECESVACCLMAYNMGITNAREVWERGIYHTDFSEKVLDLEYEIGRKMEYGTEM